MPDYLEISGRVRTIAYDGVVVEAQEVKDLLKNKSQQELNNDFSTAIEAILLLIPSAASSLNKLADKAFVNSSIATASATFRGTYNLVSDLNLTVSATHAQIGAALAGAISDEDNNDYAFVQVPTSDETPTQIAKTERYKFNGTEWEYEYDLNNSGYTADQWAAINSGINAALVTKLSALPTNADLTTALGVLTDGIAAINAKIPSAASSSNKLVDTAAMQSYITQVLDTIDATFNVNSTDGHITVQITQVNGVITNVSVTTSDIASAAALTLVTGRVTDAEANIVSLGGRMTTAEDDIDDLQQLYNNLQQSAPVVIEPTDTWPVAVADRSATVIYRVVDRVNTPPQYYSDYMFRDSDLSGQPVLMAQYNNDIDPRPKKGSQNLVTSGGVFDNMGALDVSELNATENPHTLATYADLSAAIAAIPSDYRNGGMSIKFVRSSDNKYVQYFLTKDEWSTSESDWEKINLEKELIDLSDDIYGSTIVTELPYTTIEGKYVNNTGGRSNTSSGDSTYVKVFDLTSINDKTIKIVANSFINNQYYNLWCIENGSLERALGGVLNTISAPKEDIVNLDTLFQTGSKPQYLYVNSDNISVIKVYLLEDQKGLDERVEDLEKSVVVDISKISGEAYASKDAAIVAADSLLSSDLKTGGACIKFRNSTTGEYQQCMLLSTTWSTTPSNWRGVDDTPTADSKNLVTSGGVEAKFSDIDERVSDIEHVIDGETTAEEILRDSVIEGKYVNPLGGLSISQDGINTYQYNIAEYAGKKIRLTVSATISNINYSLYSIQDSSSNVLKHGSTLNEITVPYTEIIDLSTLASPYRLLLNDDNITTITVEVLTDVKGVLQPPFEGKKIVFFGDSITAFKDSANKGYIDYLHELLGGTMYNAGIGGAAFLNRTPCYYIKVNSKATIDGTITVKFGNMNEKSFNVSSSDSVADIVTLLSNTISTGYYFTTNIIDDTVEIRPYRPNYFDVSDIVINTGSTGASITVVNTYTMCKNFTNTSDAANNLEIPNMINGLATGDWTYQRLASEYLGGDNTAKIDQLASLSINDVDLVVIFGGTNDYNLTTSDWGTPDEKANTTSWQITRSIATLLQAKPSLKIVTFTPIVRYFGGNVASWDDSLWGDNYEVNSHVGVMKSLVDVIFTCYKYWHIPCYDLYYSLGWNKYNYQKFFNNNDGTHPYKGFKQLAEKMYEYLNNIVI